MSSNLRSSTCEYDRTVDRLVSGINGLEKLGLKDVESHPPPSLSCPQYLWSGSSARSALSDSTKYVFSQKIRVDFITSASKFIEREETLGSSVT